MSVIQTYSKLKASTVVVTMSKLLVKTFPHELTVAMLVMFRSNVCDGKPITGLSCTCEEPGVWL